MNKLQSMTTVTSTEFQRNISSVFRRVVSGEHVIINSSGFPIGVLVPVGDYLAHFAEAETHPATPSKE